jgi:hypothetical protein
MAFTNVSKDFELYGFDLGDSTNLSTIQNLYFDANSPNLEDTTSSANNGSNKPVSDHFHLGLTGQDQAYRFWLQEFDLEKNQKFNHLLAQCKNIALLETRKFLFFDEKITDVVISQIFEIRILLPRNLFGLDSISDCKIGYFDQNSKNMTSFFGESKFTILITQSLFLHTAWIGYNLKYR